MSAAQAGEDRQLVGQGGDPLIFGCRRDAGQEAPARRSYAMTPPWMDWLDRDEL